MVAGDRNCCQVHFAGCWHAVWVRCERCCNWWDCVEFYCAGPTMALTKRQSLMSPIVAVCLLVFLLLRPMVQVVMISCCLCPLFITYWPGRFDVNLCDCCYRRLLHACPKNPPCAFLFRYFSSSVVICFGGAALFLLLWSLSCCIFSVCDTSIEKVLCSTRSSHTRQCSVSWPSSPTHPVLAGCSKSDHVYLVGTCMKRSPFGGN